MAAVSELSDPYANFMLNPLRPERQDVCRVCTTFTQGYDTCYRCGHGTEWADAVLPVSYSVHFGQLHTALAQYKRSPSRAAGQLQLQLAAVLWRFLARHERCLARRVGADHFDMVTTVPSGDASRDAEHPLRRIVGNIVEPTRDRYEPALRRSAAQVEQRVLDTSRYEPTRALSNENVLLVDDTWTTGASAQSAAGALRLAGAACVGVVVLGRHVHESYGDNAARLRDLASPFDWNTCALEGW